MFETGAETDVVEKKWTVAPEAAATEQLTETTDHPSLADQFFSASLPDNSIGQYSAESAIADPADRDPVFTAINWEQDAYVRASLQTAVRGMIDNPEIYTEQQAIQTFQILSKNGTLHISDIEQLDPEMAALMMEFHQDYINRSNNFQVSVEEALDPNFQESSPGTIDSNLLGNGTEAVIDQKPPVVIDVEAKDIESILSVDTNQDGSTDSLEVIVEDENGEAQKFTLTKVMLTAAILFVDAALFNGSTTNVLVRAWLNPIADQINEKVMLALGMSKEQIEKLQENVMSDIIINEMPSTQSLVRLITKFPPNSREVYTFFEKTSDELRQKMFNSERFGYIDHLKLDDDQKKNILSQLSRPQASELKLENEYSKYVLNQNQAQQQSTAAAA